MRNDGLAKTFTASAAVAAKRIVKHDGAGGAAQAGAVSDAIFGVADLGADKDARLDVFLSGIAEVEYGGNVSAGDPLTADGDGKAVKATLHTHKENAGQAYAKDANTGVASGVRIIGFAMVDGASGDIGSVHIAPGHA